MRLIRQTALVLVLIGLAGCADSGTETSQTTPPTRATSSPPRPAPTPSPTTAPRPTGPFIASVVWTKRDGRRALSVTPTAALRSSATRDVADAAWREVVARVPSADTRGMADQLACHVLFVPEKLHFYLEPWRPAVGYANTVAAQCNPGDIRDPDQP
ncbi:DUF2599 domain-containing protein [Luteipulveratus mongoliensis]|uniref:DUF2599 domain-containing protein n=1 Tax=Luteipulveratus mongoliensis TaxID=571913 RepID=UPI001C54D4B4|nr:DUF2599 domain-containing protein [Luteipulveratus mongoliensis]